MNTATWSSFEC